MKNQLKRIAYFAIKKEGFIPLSLDRLSITVYFSFLISLKRGIYLARAREGTCKNIFKNWCLPQCVQKESWWCESNSYFRSPVNFQIWDFCKCGIHFSLMYWNYISCTNKIFSIKNYQRLILLLLLLLLHFYMFEFFFRNYSHFELWIPCLPPFSM